MNCFRLFPVFALLMIGLAFGAGSGRARVLESDSSLLSGAVEKHTSLSQTFFLIRGGIIASVGLWQQFNTAVVVQRKDGSAQPYDWSSANFTSLYAKWSDAEKEAISHSKVIVVQQRRSLDDCLVNELSGGRVLEEDVEAQSRTQRMVKCGNVRSVLVGAGYDTKNIQAVMHALEVRASNNPDAGVPPP